MVDLSVVIPVYKSANTLVALHRRLGAVFRSAGLTGEVIYVNDASPDNSVEMLRSLPETTPFQIVNLRHNLGQSSALLAGMLHCNGNLIATMDADLQDEPEVLPKLIHALESNDIVFAQRSGRYESGTKLVTSALFKSIVHIASSGRIPMQAGLFLVIKKNAALRLVPYLPFSPYLIGLIAKEKLTCTAIPVTRRENDLGETSYTFRKRMHVAGRFFNTLRMKPVSDVVASKRWLSSHLAD
ncbi:glycosyltransferase family 2 protein [Dyadobacter aurulentus]|uniref:glycosyltransferase family 2 protein n=1 Tax=Dyadobacter sp. UC 10 TaxID=2605428 RepID=UPI0011F1A5E7|nr:glycosyltransferase family 2 protein [Dyadobacter sp. UC 10]KAA0992343.1 glycosyltransferase family 2 protein [Dyadobacter sp. UC 10]